MKSILSKFLILIFSLLIATPKNAMGITDWQLGGHRSPAMTYPFNDTALSARGLWGLETLRGNVFSLARHKKEIRAHLNEVPIRNWRLSAEVLWLTLKQQIRLYGKPGAELLREALASHYGLHLDAVAVVPGGSTGLLTPIQYFTQLIESGSKILVSVPNFEGFLKNIHKPVWLHTLESDHFLPTPKDVEAKLSEDKTIRMVILTNPGNPSGKTFDPVDFEDLIKRYPHVYFLFDQAYTEFWPERSAASFVRHYSNVMVMGTFSKAYGIPDERVGYFLMQKHPMYPMQNLIGIRPFSTVQEGAAVFALHQQERISSTVEKIKKWRVFLEKELQQIPKLMIYPSDANFFLINLNAWGTGAAKKLITFLAQRRISVKDVSEFRGLEGGEYLRITVVKPLDILTMVRAIRDFYVEEITPLSPRFKHQDDEGKTTHFLTRARIYILTSIGIAISLGQLSIYYDPPYSLEIASVYIAAAILLTILGLIRVHKDLAVISARKMISTGLFVSGIHLISTSIYRYFVLLNWTSRTWDWSWEYLQEFVTNPVAAFPEEVLFRGFILRKIQTWMPFIYANTIQAAIFAGLHFFVLPMNYLPSIFLSGLLYGWAYHRKGLGASITAHATFNLIQTFTPYSNVVEPTFAAVFIMLSWLISESHPTLGSHREERVAA